MNLRFQKSFSSSETLPGQHCRSCLRDPGTPVSADPQQVCRMGVPILFLPWWNPSFSVERLIAVYDIPMDFSLTSLILKVLLENQNVS